MKILFSSIKIFFIFLFLYFLNLFFYSAWAFKRSPDPRYMGKMGIAIIGMVGAFLLYKAIKKWLFK